MVFDETRDLRDVLKRLGHFFAHESCGKCYPCQMGTQRQKEILTRIADGKTLDGDIERLQDVGWTMTDASLCGLGQTAASAVLSAMKLWPEMFGVRKSESLKVAKAKKKDESAALPKVSKGGKKKEAKSAAKNVKRKTNTAKKAVKKAEVKKKTAPKKPAKSKTSKPKAKKTSVKKK